MTLKSSSARDEGRWTCTGSVWIHLLAASNCSSRLRSRSLRRTGRGTGGRRADNSVGPKGNVNNMGAAAGWHTCTGRDPGTALNEQHAQFSPDGQWIAYQSDKTGRVEVYVRPVAGSGADVAVSTSGGSQVRWSPKGTELFYIAADDTLMTVSIRATRTDSPIQLGTPQALFPTNVGTTAPNTNRHQCNVVSPDGESLVMNSVPESSAASLLSVVLNWKPRPSRNRREAVNR